MRTWAHYFCAPLLGVISFDFFLPDESDVMVQPPEFIEIHASSLFSFEHLTVYSIVQCQLRIGRFTLFKDLLWLPLFIWRHRSHCSINQTRIMSAWLLLMINDFLELFELIVFFFLYCFVKKATRDWWRRARLLPWIAHIEVAIAAIFCKNTSNSAIYMGVPSNYERIWERVSLSLRSIAVMRTSISSESKVWAESWPDKSQQRGAVLKVGEAWGEAAPLAVPWGEPPGTEPPG